MCHGAACAFFPPIARSRLLKEAVTAHAFGDETATPRIAILPDIYGCNPFYRGLATYLAECGAQVFLVDPFAEQGELAEVTREAAFERRHQIADAAFIEDFLAFAAARSVDAVIGFCLGGYYVFELARRDFPGTLIGLYGFPQGMVNRDPLPVPFDYLADLGKRHVMIMGACDVPVGPENVSRLAEVARGNPAIALTVFDDAGHGFLADLDSDSAEPRRTAQAALRIVEDEIFGAARNG